MHLKREAEVHQGPGVCPALYVSWVKESGASRGDRCVNMMQLLCALSCKSSLPDCRIWAGDRCDWTFQYYSCVRAGG